MGTTESYYLAADDASRIILFLIHFVRLLRARGMALSTSETLDAVAALDAIDVSSRAQVRAALRCALVKDGDAGGLFDRLFRRCFPPVALAGPESRRDPDAGGAGSPAFLREFLGESGADRLEDALAEVVDRLVDPASADRRPGHHLRRVLRQLNLAELVESSLRDRTGISDSSATVSAFDDLRGVLETLVADRLGAPPEIVPSAADLDDVPLLTAGPDEIEAMRRALRPLARKLASLLGRRRRRGNGAVDIRRTIRRSVEVGGVPMHLAVRRRRPTRPDLVVLCDVSGSMARSVPFILRLLHSLHAEFDQIRSFVFVDGVAEVTGLLDSAPGVPDPRALLRNRGLVAGDGRSDYQRALSAFLERWPEVVTPKTTVVVVGDARSHDRPPALPQTTELRARSRRLYWLNPEPRGEWDEDDSRMRDYQARCTAAYEAATLRQLGEAVARIA